jgi:subtilase family serine protease
MREYKRRVWIGAIMVLSLLAGVCAPASILADSAKMIASPASTPDLIIETVTWSPEIPLIGNTVTFTLTVKNQGSDQAVSSHFAYYIDDAYQTSFYTDPIDAGAAVTKTFTWKAQAGSHVIKVVADNNDEVTESDETNNAKTFAFSVLAPDLIIDTVSWSPEEPAIDDIVTFTVTIKNQGNSRARCSHVSLYIDGYFRGSQDVPRIDAYAAVSKTFTWKAPAGSHTVKAVADALNQVTEGDETNNEKTLTCPTSAPDLIINKISWSPTDFTEGVTATFTVTIKNQGSSKAYPSYVAYYIDDTYQTSAYVNHIDPGDKIEKTFTWKAQTGLHTVKAVADTNQTISESDETNNDKIVDLPAFVPDLIIQDVSWTPSSPLIDHDVTFTVTLKNQGRGDAGHFRLYFYIDDAEKYQQIVPELGTGDTITKTFQWTAKSASHTIKIVADGENHVDEGNESNNVKTKTIKLSSAPAPELIIQDITWSPENPLIDDTVTFTVSIKNQGSGQISHFLVDYYIDDNYQTSASINQINAGATIAKTFTWKAQVGFHTFKAVADPNNKITESDSTIKEKTVVLLTRAPDLVIQGITWSPLSPSTGDPVTFTVTLKNQGGEKASRSHVGYYIDGASRGYHDVPEIDVDATATTTFTWTAQEGSHTIKAVADMQSQIPEFDELNNERVLTFPAPDLTIDKITWSPENPSIDDIITFSVDIKNQGNGRADSSCVYLYIDDHSQGYYNIQGIDAGAKGTTTLTWRAQAGAHFITAITDGENGITESDESNNEKIVAFAVFSPPAVNPAPVSTPVSTNSPDQEASVQLYSEINQVAPGEDIVFNLHAFNPVTNPTMTVQLILEVPSEISVTSSEFTKDDNGQYTASYIVAPGDAQQIEVLSIANQEGNFDITGLLTCYLDGNESAVDSQILSLPVTVGTGESTAEESLTSFLSGKGSWFIWWFVLAVVVLGGTALVYMFKFRRQRH